LRKRAQVMEVYIMYGESRLVGVGYSGLACL